MKTARELYRGILLAHDNQEASLVSKTKTEPLEVIRFESGKLEGLKLVLQFLEENIGNETQGS